MAENKRCWPGYEPVKGKDQHEQGSCRPKAEAKESSSEKQFRAKRKRQLDEWQGEHPKTRRSAAQHLGAPDKAPKKAKKSPSSKSQRPSAASKSKKKSKKAAKGSK